MFRVFHTGTAHQSSATDDSQPLSDISRQESTTTYLCARPLSELSRQESTTTMLNRQQSTTTMTSELPDDEQLPPKTPPRGDYLTFDSSAPSSPVKSDAHYQKLNIDTAHPSLYDEIS